MRVPLFLVAILVPLDPDVDFLACTGGQQTSRPALAVIFFGGMKPCSFHVSLCDGCGMHLLTSSGLRAATISDSPLAPHWHPLADELAATISSLAQ